ncbi:MAG: hypothetical protein V4547_07195 [Bacteroidota bacterium]
MKQYNQFVRFIGNNYSCFIFISIFYSLCLLFKYASTFNPELQSFTGRMIGEATLQGYDINKRIKAFYQAGALFLFGTVFISIIFWRASSYFKEFFKAPEIQIINYTSLAGIILCFFTLWGSPIKSSLELIFCVQTVSITIYVLKNIFFKNTNITQNITASFYAIAFVLGFSVFFIWNEIVVLFDFLPKANLLYILFITVVVAFFLVAQLIKHKNSIESRNEINRLAYLLLPLALIPLLSVLKDETYLILNGHHVYYFSPRKLYLMGILCLAASIAWRYRITIKKPLLAFAKNTDELVAKRYFPLLILGIFAFTFYSPFIQASTEMFEAGNQYLPLMEFQKFGVIPIIEKFNSHQLFELFWGGLYVLFNGLHGRELPLYDFMDLVVLAALEYYFIYKISRNAYVSLFIVLLFPLFDSFIHSNRSIAFVAIFILHAMINQKASIRNYLLLISCTAILILWRLEIGYPSAIAIAGTLFIYWMNEKRFVFDRKLLLKSILFFSFSCLLLLGAIAWWRDINVFDKLLNGFNYLASAQSYGYIDLGDETTTVFKMQYFVFPVVLLLGFCALLVFFKQYTISGSQRFIYTSLIFLTLYYFVNFQRGIVAHTLAGGPDNWLSPFLFLIISASVYLFLYKRSTVAKFILFIVFSSFLIMNYKHPAINAPQNIYSQTIEKATNFPRIEPRENIVRCINDLDHENRKFSNFKKLVDEVLTEKQTFIDFTNTPMLYYFTGKISPSYFNQNPLTIHNDHLQKKFISDLKNYDTPFILFSNFPETWWDNAIGVPNTMRHYRMAEYFYNNYQPFIIVDSLCIWKRNDFKIKNDQKLIYNYTEQLSDSSKINPFIKGVIKNSKNKNYLFKVNSNKFKDKTVQMPLPIIESTIGTQNIMPNFVDEINHIGYYIFKTSESGFSFQLKNEDKNINVLDVYECDHIPDFYSSKPKNHNINQVPYIWGTYDKTVHEEKMLANLLSKTQILPNNTIHHFNFSNDIDKSTGNTLFISLECDNETPATMELMYGSDKKEYKGTFVFSIPPGKGKRDFAIRISSQYNWYASNNNYLALNCKNIESVKLDSIKLLKGN